MLESLGPGLLDSPLMVLFVIQLVTLGLAVSALVLWRIRYREKVVYVKDLAEMEVAETAEDIGAAIIVLFTDQGRVVASANIEEATAASSLMRESIRNLDDLGVEVEAMQVRGRGTALTIVHVANVGERRLYAAAVRPGMKPISPDILKKTVAERFSDVIGTEVKEAEGSA